MTLVSSILKNHQFPQQPHFLSLPSIIMARFSKSNYQPEWPPKTFLSFSIKKSSNTFSTCETHPPSSRRLWWWASSQQRAICCWTTRYRLERVSWQKRQLLTVYSSWMRGVCGNTRCVSVWRLVVSARSTWCVRCVMGSSTRWRWCWSDLLVKIIRRT